MVRHGSGDVYRIFLRHSLATPVAIASCQHGLSRRAITIGSITSVSIQPPMILICLQNHGRMETLISKARLFSVHILAQQQVHIAQTFANPNLPEEEYPRLGLHFQENESEQVMDGCLGTMHCEVKQSNVHGDHTVFIANVNQYQLHQKQTPLLYFDRTFSKLQKLQ